MKKDYKHFIISSCILLTGLLVADFFFGYIGKKLVSKIPNEGERLIKVNYVTNRLDSTDILIYGSSRAEHHYIPSYLKTKIDSLLHVDYSIYNAGVGGHFLSYNCCWIECALNRYTPKIIILDIFEFFFYDDYTKHLNDLYAYYGNNPIVTHYLDNTSLKEKLQLQSNLFKYNEKFPRYLSSIFLKKETNHHDGFIPLSGVMTEKDTQEVNQTNGKKELKIDILNQFKHILDLCNKRGVKLIISTSPRLMYTEKNRFIASLCSQYKIPLIDMESHAYFNRHPELFRDPGHLNQAGAEKFMEFFWEELEPLLR